MLLELVILLVTGTPALSYDYVTILISHLFFIQLYTLSNDTLVIILIIRI